MTAKTIHIQYMKTAYGELVLGTYREAEKAALCLCDWRYRKMRSAVDKRVQHRLGASFIEKKIS